MKMALDQFSTIYHDLWSKRNISSLIAKVWYISFIKRWYKNNKLKKNKYTTKTKILSLCLGSPWINSLLGLRDSGVWGLPFALILAVGSFGFFPFASILARIHWNFHRGRRDLVCYGHLKHLGMLLWRRGARIWELADIWVILDALRSPQAGISRNPSDVKGFTPRDITVIPGYSGELLCEPALSLLYPQGICSLLLGLSCLFE